MRTKSAFNLHQAAGVELRPLLALGIDLEQFRRASEVARQAQDAAVLAVGRIPEAMIEASRKAAEVAAFALLGGPSVAKQLQEALERIRTAFRFVPDVVDVVEEARKRKEELDRLPARVRDLLQVLGEHGWYPDYIMPFPDIFDLAEALEQGDAEGAHERLCQHFEERMDEILEDLTASFPQRAGILRLAFGAHRRGEYALSIPALLAQTDGICKELVGVQLYGRQKSGRLRLAKTVESWRKSDLGKAMLHPLLVVLPIAFREDERDGVAGILNRHGVLHGEDVTYGNRRNGCRAISLLAYVASRLRDRTPEEHAA